MHDHHLADDPLIDYSKTLPRATDHLTLSKYPTTAQQAAIKVKLNITLLTLFFRLYYSKDWDFLMQVFISLIGHF
jgi:hypothetical protein